MRSRLAFLCVLTWPALADAGGSGEPYEAQGMGEGGSAEQYHLHDVAVTLDELPRTDGVRVVVEDAHAGVHVVVNVAVRRPGEEPPP